MRKILCSALCAACLLAAGCKADEPLQSGSHPEVRMSSWVVTWDADKGWKEYGKTRKEWNDLSYFAAFFDEKGSLHVPENFRKADMGEGHFYLTFVNDVHPSQGKAIEKDTAVLQKALADESSRRQHVKEILALAEEAGVDGIEIDYERIGKDKALAEKFASFTKTLFLESAAAHKKVRIILEPSMPMDLPYSRGPEYVVMAYNLYGLHSGPGPKADGPFIQKTLQKMKSLPEKRALAFSKGGCLWKDAGLFGLQKGKAQFITEEKARELAEIHGQKPERDGASAALHFSYKENGSSYDVWYADQETLAAWITLAAREGIPSVSLWRLGG